ncbi:MAG TPA: alpha/beta hydrolase [Phycisphaerae bacterium]|nr:alpha/beta hydrolase [Phycisphaerae bacterium]
MRAAAMMVAVAAGAMVCVAQTTPAGAPGRMGARGARGGGKTVAAAATQKDVPVSRVDESKYTVEANIPYDKYTQTVLDVIYPKGGGPEAKEDLPGVVMFHGGGWIETDKSTMSSFYNRFLAHGFIVCNVEYRMANPGGATAPAAVEDALNATKWFWDHADHYHVDKNRFIVTGGSAGGHLALMVGMATPEAKLGPTNPRDFKIAAIVNGYGPTDLPDLIARHTGWAIQWLPNDAPDHDALALRVSPKTYARKDMPPLLTVQGSRDNTVPVAENEALVKEIQEKGGDATIYLAPGAGHGFSNATWPGVEHEIFDVWLPEHHIIPPPPATAPAP